MNRNLVKQIIDQYPSAQIVSNISIFGVPCIPYQGIEDFDKYNNGRDGIIFIIDEIHILFNALESAKMPLSTMQVWAQNRKNRRLILGTSQRFNRVAKGVREQTTWNYECQRSILGFVYPYRVLDGASYDDNGRYVLEDGEKMPGRNFYVPNVSVMYVLENQRERGEKEGNAGCLHVHMLIFIDQYIPQADLTTCWKHGFIKINALDNVRSVAAYVCKYITKDNFAAFGQKVYGCSLGLNRGTEERFYTEGMSDNTYLHPKDVLKALDVTYYDKMHHGYIAQDGSAQQMTVSYYQGRWKGANVIEVAKANDRSDETENL